MGENIAYGLKARRLPQDQIATKVAEAARLVQLEGLIDRMPAQLSGGQQQRVVLARALTIEPRLLLMDEPLSNLDAKLRVQIRSLIRALQRKLQITTIYVTHDQEEALAISDTIAVMDRGHILQVGKPWELYLRPGSRFVADFIGTMNVLHGKVEGPGRGPEELTVVTEFGERWQVRATASPGQSISIGVRPESLQLAAGSECRRGLELAQGDGDRGRLPGGGGPVSGEGDGGSQRHGRDPQPGLLRHLRRGGLLDLLVFCQPGGSPVPRDGACLRWPDGGGISGGA